MYNYMYQYRGEIECIIKNVGKEHAISHLHGLYHKGLVDIKEWGLLREYCESYRKSYRGDII